MGIAERRDLGRVALIMGAVQSGIWLVVGVIGVMTASRFEKILADFDAKLPVVTECAINFARFARIFWPVAVVAVLLWPGAMWGVDRLLSKVSEGVLLRVLWLVATWSAIPLAVALFFVSLFMPLMSLIDK